MKEELISPRVDAVIPDGRRRSRGVLRGKSRQFSLAAFRRPAGLRSWEIRSVGPQLGRDSARVCVLGATALSSFYCLC